MTKCMSAKFQKMFPTSCIILRIQILKFVVVVVVVVVVRPFKTIFQFILGTAANEEQPHLNLHCFANSTHSSNVQYRKWASNGYHQKQLYRNHTDLSLQNKEVSSELGKTVNQASYSKTYPKVLLQNLCRTYSVKTISSN